MENTERAEHTAGRNIAELRKQRGWSQEHLADAMRARGFGWNQSTATKTEKAARPLRVNELVELADVFGVRAAWLLVDVSDDERGRAWRDVLAALNRATAAREQIEAAQAEYDAAKAAQRRADDAWNALQEPKGDNDDG